MDIVSEIIALDIDMNNVQVFAGKMDALRTEYDIGPVSLSSIINLSGEPNSIIDR